MPLKEPVTVRLLLLYALWPNQRKTYDTQLLHSTTHCTHAAHIVQETNAAFSSLTKYNLDPNPPNFLSGTDGLWRAASTVRLRFPYTLQEYDKQYKHS